MEIAVITHEVLTAIFLNNRDLKMHGAVLCGTQFAGKDIRYII